MKSLIIVLAIVVISLAIGFILRNNITAYFFSPTDTETRAGTNKNETPAEDIKIVAQDLNIPWEIVFLPDSSILVTQRTGMLRRIGLNEAAIDVPGVVAQGEGGLLGMALHPDFRNNHWLYLYRTTKENGTLINQVVRFTFVGNSLTEKKIIIDHIPAGSNHDGGRIAFGPEGYLYVTTGAAGNGRNSQDTSSLAGKILRLKDDGSIPEDNPFKNAVWSFGHRNVQGITWDDKGRLWAAEHGRSGLQSGYDEINLIRKGANYGWPLIQGNEQKAGMITPVITSGPDKTWAPSGAQFYHDSIFFAGLRGQALYQARITADAKVSEIISHYRQEFGRLREVKLGPDGYFYLLTNNTDGRGRPKKGDDKVIRLMEPGP
jgi:glucose/arabinose dehydrogenase